MSEVGRQITVAMITRNEERAVAKVISDIRTAVPDAEIVVVDSSTDRTAQIAESLGARVILQLPPRGYGPAMDTALRSSEREVIVTLDCDDTYPVNFIEPMARMIVEDGYDLVDGSRLAEKPDAMPWINYLANWFFALSRFSGILSARERSSQRDARVSERIDRESSLRRPRCGSAGGASTAIDSAWL